MEWVTLFTLICRTVVKQKMLENRVPDFFFNFNILESVQLHLATCMSINYMILVNILFSCLKVKHFILDPWNAECPYIDHKKKNYSLFTLPLSCTVCMQRHCTRAGWGVNAGQKSLEFYNTFPYWNQWGRGRAVKSLYCWL